MSNFFYLDALFFIKKQSKNDDFDKRFYNFKQEIKKIFNNDFCPQVLKMSKLFGEKIVFTEEYYNPIELEAKNIDNMIMPFYLTNRSKTCSFKSFYKDRFKTLKKIKGKIENTSKEYKINGGYTIKIYHKNRKSLGLFDAHKDIIINTKKTDEILF